jgi:hypothetical protein
MGVNIFGEFKFKYRFLSLYYYSTDKHKNELIFLDSILRGYVATVYFLNKKLFFVIDDIIQLNS